jgi:hypothetical protein
MKGAFTLMSFKDSEVPLLGARLSEERAIFFICGIFGWTGTPAAFQVVTRAIQYEVNRLVFGLVQMYVDDIFGISVRGKVDQDVETTVSFCRALFKSDCVEPSKTEVGQRVGVIGSTLDLDQEVVSMSEKNFHRVVYGLAEVRKGNRATVKMLQRFGSWLSRYSEVIPVLKPLAKTIHRSFCGMHREGAVELDGEVLRTLQVFRAIFILSVAEWARRLITFCGRDPGMVVEFDASLFGGGPVMVRMERWEG